MTSRGVDLAPEILIVSMKVSPGTCIQALLHTADACSSQSEGREPDSAIARWGCSEDLSGLQQDVLHFVRDMVK